MEIGQEIIELKKELALLRIKKVTKQKIERHNIKKIQHKISQMHKINSNKNK